MSHLPERKEKNCLNCGAEVAGRFCQVCGQENLEPKESAWHLTSHFINDITHFDGKFFSSLKYLVLKPGFLSAEYMKGRRASYLNPIRMYVFTSAIFFLIFFTFNKVNEKTFSNVTVNGKTKQMIETMDSTNLAKFSTELSGRKMSRSEVLKYFDSSSSIKSGIHFTNTHYKSREEYDSVLKSGKKHHNWLERNLIYKTLDLNKEFNNDSSAILRSLILHFFHLLPQMLFLTLPIFALMLKLLYVRRKNFYYADHGIWVIHNYVFIFLAMLAIILLTKGEESFNLQFIKYVKIFIYFSIFFYLYKSMRNFYLQRRAKTIVKYFLLLFSASFILTILFAVYFILSFFQL